MYEGNPGDIDFGSSQRGSSYLACVASVSVGLEQRKTEERDFRFCPREK